MKLAAVVTIAFLSTGAGISRGQSRAKAPIGRVQVSGSIVDVTGQPLQYSEVVLVRSPRGEAVQAVWADEEGRFAFRPAPSHPYEIRITAAGFATKTLRIPSVAADGPIDLGQVRLRLGEISGDPVVPTAVPRRVKTISVCEALAKREKLRLQNAVIVGRLDCGASLTDSTCFLSQDTCPRPVNSDGRRWPNRIYLEMRWRQEGAKPQGSSAEIPRDAAIAKLQVVRKTTELGFHWVPAIEMERDKVTSVRSVEEKDEWGRRTGDSTFPRSSH